MFAFAAETYTHRIFIILLLCCFLVVCQMPLVMKCILYLDLMFFFFFHYFILLNKIDIKINMNSTNYMPCTDYWICLLIHLYKMVAYYMCVIDWISCENTLYSFYWNQTQTFHRRLVKLVVFPGFMLLSLLPWLSILFAKICSRNLSAVFISMYNTVIHVYSSMAEWHKQTSNLWERSLFVELKDNKIFTSGTCEVSESKHE